jgi:prepilin peptidase CpaA
MHQSAHFTLPSLAIVVSLCAAVCDLRTRQIPNRLIAGGLAVAVACVVALNASYGLSAVGWALLCSLLGLLFCALWPVVLYAANGLGGGDVKLFAFAGACLGPVVGLEAQAYAFVFGLAYAVGYLIYQRALFAALRVSLVAIANPFLPKARQRQVELNAQAIPFAPAISLGIAVAALVREAL